MRVHVNVNYRYLADELAYLIDNADAEIVVFHGALGEQMAAVRDRCPSVRAVVQVDDGSPELDGALRYEDLLGASTPMERIPRSGDDLWFLYTGGTTGMPKGVMWRHEDLFGALAEAVYPVLGEPIPDDTEGVGAAAARFGESGRAPVHLPASPLMHGTGGMTSMQAMFLGGTIVTLVGRHFDADELWRSVEHDRVSQMAIVGDAFCKPMVRALDEAAARGEPYDLLVAVPRHLLGRDVERARQGGADGAPAGHVPRLAGLERGGRLRQQRHRTGAGDRDGPVQDR